MINLGRLLAASVMCVLLGGATASAAEKALDLLDASVAYSADFTVNSAKGTYRGKVWHDRGRERRDYGTRSGSQAILVRRDLDAAYLLNPDKRWYVGLGIDAVLSLGGLHGLTVERTRLGEDQVAGVKATRYRLAATGPKGETFDGEGWFSKDGICLRLTGTLTEKGKATGSPVETSLSNLRVGRTDTAMFDVPKGWFGLDLRSVPADKIVPALEKMRPMLEGR